MPTARLLPVPLLCVILLAAPAGAATSSPDAGAALPGAGVFDDPVGTSGGRFCDLALVSSLDARAELLDAAADPAPDDGGPGRGVATMASLVVPGAGQLLKGEARGYAYLLAEAAFWVAYSVLNEEGLDIRSEYEAYADAHWDREGYEAFYDAYCTSCEGDECPDGCRPLAPDGSQEYYEDIGKYSVYWPWWSTDDGDEDVPGAETSPVDQALRDDYWGMRKDSNRNLRNARYFMTAAFLNHIVSAADAFLNSKDASVSDLAATRDTGLIFDVADGGDGIRCSLIRAF